MKPTKNTTFLTRTVTASAALLVLAACAPHQAASPATTPTLAPPPNPSDPATAVKVAYEQFWTVSRTAESRPPDQWQSQLESVAADPILTQLVTGFRTLDDQKISLYGTIVPHVTSVQVTGDHATAIDCQDASHAGQADATTGAPKTVGIPRNPVLGTLQLGPDARWRVTRIDYPRGTC